MNQADLIRTALALRYAAVLVRSQLAPASRVALAMEADKFGDPPPQTIALTSDLLTEAARFLGGSGAIDELTAWRDLVVLYIGDTPASRAAHEDDTRKWIRGQLNAAAEDRAQLRFARAALRYLGTQLERLQVLVADGSCDEAAAALHDLLDTPGLRAAEEQVDAALLRAGEAVPR